MLIQSDTEIEGVNMALGAAATGARAATGSTGQGVALMQEAIAEAALNELPLVIFTMGRGQQDYFQCTRGGGWGDYRTITLAPSSVVEADEHTRLAFELADKWLTPVILYGDHMIGFTQMTVEHDPSAPARRSRQAVGARRQLRRHRPVEGDLDLAERQAQHSRSRPRPALAQRRRQVRRARQRSRRVTSLATSTAPATSSCRSVPPVPSSTTSSTSCAPRDTAIGTFRPVTLWPFPSDALADVAAAMLRAGAGVRAQRGPDGRRRPVRGRTARCPCARSAA